MKMLHVTIHSRCLEKSVKFYQEVCGLDIAGDMRPMGGNIVFLANGEGETNVEIIGDADGAYEGKEISIGFKTDDVEKKREELAAAGYNPTPMISPNPHVKFFFVKDPNGFDVQFM